MTNDQPSDDTEIEGALRETLNRKMDGVTDALVGDGFSAKEEFTHYSVGGLHDSSVGEVVDDFISQTGFDDIGIIAGPTSISDHHYEMKAYELVWNQKKERWEVKSNSLRDPFSNLFAAEADEVHITEFGEYTNKIESLPVELVISGISKEGISDVVHSVLTKYTQMYETRVMVTPIYGTTSYRVGVEVIQWSERNPMDGEWVKASLHDESTTK